MIHNFSCLSYHPPQTFPIPILLQFLWNTPIPFLSYRNRIPIITRDSNYPLTRISLLYHIHFNGRPFPELTPFPPFLCSFLSSLSVVANFSKFSTWYRFLGYNTYDIFISFNSYISYFFFSSIFDQWIHFLFLTIFFFVSIPPFKMFVPLHFPSWRGHRSGDGLGDATSVPYDVVSLSYPSDVDVGSSKGGGM